MDKNQELAELKRELAALGKQVARLAKQSRDVGAEIIEEEMENAEESLASWMNRVKDYSATGKRKVREAAQSTQAYAEENPWHMAAAAGALGLLVGFLASRSRD